MDHIFNNVFRNSERTFFLRVVLLVFFFLNLGQISARDVTLVWNPSGESDLAGYKVYVGFEPRRYRYCLVAGLEVTYTVTDLPDLAAVYFAVTAYDSAGCESGYSSEVSLARSDITANFTLMANYPNPFNPVTQIPFVLYRSMPVHLAVYNLLGQEVKLLAEGEQPAGEHIYQWDGTNRDDNDVSNGVYLCRLIVGDFCQTQKLILAR